MNAFAAGIEALATDPDMAVAGTLMPAAGGSSACRVLLQRRDKDMPVGETHARSQGWVAVIPQADVQTRPRRGDELAADGKSFLIGDVATDSAGVAWRLDLDVIG